MVDVSARRLRRYFSGTFDAGGRLFGGFWQHLPKAARHAGIRIEGAPVAGLDYSGMNPLLAYSLVGAEPPEGDPYTLPGLEQNRAGVKKVFNTLMFDAKRRKGFPQGVRRLFPKSVTVGAVITALLQKHPRLAPLLGTGAGRRMQFLESQIMMQVLMSLRHMGIIGLPVFDAAVAKAAEADTVERIMEEEFKAVTGLTPRVHREA